MPFRRVNTILIPIFSTLALQLFRSPTTLWNRRSSPYTAPTSHPFSLMRFYRSELPHKTGAEKHRTPEAPPTAALSLSTSPAYLRRFRGVRLSKALPRT